MRRILLLTTIATTLHAAPKDPATTKELVADLVAKGFKAKAAGTGETLVCNKDGGCVCLVELSCKGPCITLEKNLAAFKQALHPPPDSDRSVDCEIADTGMLCEGSFFRFQGDMYRDETRYFDKAGNLIGQYNTSGDSFEYCGGKARVRYMGAQPRCEKPSAVKTICSDGKKHAPVPDPRGRLERALAPAAP